MKKSYIYQPVKFYLIVNLIIWTSWMIVAYFSYQPGGGPKAWISVLEFIGLLSPLGTALAMIYTSKNSELKRNFQKRLFDLKLIRPASLPMIFLIIPATVLVSVLISYFFFGQPLTQLLFDKNPFTSGGLIPIPLLLFSAALIEEVGWKGYGMDSLRGKRSFFKATLIFGALWAFWHGPLFFVDGYYQNMLLKTNPWFALNFVVSILIFAFFINWLWHMNNGSILTGILCHALVNFQGILQMGQIAKCIQTLVWIIVVMIIVSTNKKIFFSQFPAQIGYFGQNKS